MDNEILLKSWFHKSKPVNETKEILQWIQHRNESTRVSIKKSCLSKSQYWFYDNRLGMIRNHNNSFFQVSGLSVNNKDQMLVEQPILLQYEIGYLGIICKVINGVLHFLMQAKIEPGNVNCVQISPTIQATKSNFTLRHGGSKPKYLEYFISADKHTILYDQIQSEQSSRFLGKRNRNTIILVDEEVEEFDTHRWMTLHQIKQLMKIPNLVNMDTRTVLSCLPILWGEVPENVEVYFTDMPLYRSMFYCDENELSAVYHYINNYKMFNGQKRELVPLYSLKEWKYNSNNEFVCENPYSFKLIHCDIEIEGREVRHWDQPLLEANGRALFGLFTCIDDGIRKFLVKAKPEIGAFDQIELGPSVQRESVSDELKDSVYQLFIKKQNLNEGIMFNNVLSEEGGRFYHEENENVIIEIDKSEISELPDCYFWLTYRTLNSLIQINNTVNIQLRNLISLLEI